MKRSVIKANRAIWQRRLDNRAAKLARMAAAKRPAKVIAKQQYKVKVAAANRNKWQLRLDKAPLPLRLRAWHIAGTYVGTIEHGGNNRGKVVEQIIHANGGAPGEPWCGDFDAFVYRLAGSKAVSRSWAAVRSFWGRLAGVAIISAAKARMGDIVTFTFEHTGLFGYWCDHQGRKCDRSVATHIFTREGNTGAIGDVSDSAEGDGVKEKVRAIGLIKTFNHVSR